MSCSVMPRDEDRRRDDPLPMRENPESKVRYRLLGLSTLVYLSAWMGMAWWVWDVYLPRLELSAMFSYFASVGMGGQNPRGGESSPPIDVGVSVLVRTGWFAVMCLAGVVMLVAAAGGLAGASWSRRPLLAAGYSTLAATLATIVGIALLIQRAGFPATITPLAYALIAAAQSSHGWLLIFSCGGRGKRPNRWEGSEA